MPNNGHGELVVLFNATTPTPVTRRARLQRHYLSKLYSLITHVTAP